MDKSFWGRGGFLAARLKQVEASGSGLGSRVCRFRCRVFDGDKGLNEKSRRRNKVDGYGGESQRRVNGAQIGTYIQSQDTEASSGFVLRVLCKVKSPCSKAKAIIQPQTPRRTDVVRIYLLGHSLEVLYLWIQRHAVMKDILNSIWRSYS